MTKLTTEDFIKKAKLVHNNLYDYSKVEYKGTYEKIIIIDPDYGEFWQTPSNHLSGCGCPKRSSANLRIKFSKRDRFIKQANIVHNNLYDYSKVEYINNCTKVCIIDPDYGEFWQRPNNHLRGIGSPERKTLTIKDRRQQKYSKKFIEEANIVHNNFYDYSKTVYVDNRTDIIVTDPEYGDFITKPFLHKNGSVHPKRQKYNTHEYEIDHIIPISFIVDKFNRKCFDHELKYLFECSFNKTKITKHANRIKGNKINLFGEIISASDYRNDIELIRYLFKREHNINIFDFTNNWEKQ